MTRSNRPAGARDSSSNAFPWRTDRDGADGWIDRSSDLHTFAVRSSSSTPRTHRTARAAASSPSRPRATSASRDADRSGHQEVAGPARRVEDPQRGDGVDPFGPALGEQWFQCQVEQAGHHIGRRVVSAEALANASSGQYLLVFARRAGTGSSGCHAAQPRTPAPGSGQG